MPEVRYKVVPRQGALYNLATIYFERLRKEECGDETALAERALASLKQWLEKHPKALERRAEKRALIDARYPSRRGRSAQASWGTRPAGPKRL